MRRMEIDCVSKGDRLMIRIEYLFTTDYICGSLISESVFPFECGSYIICVDKKDRYKVENRKYIGCLPKDIVCLLKKGAGKVERKIKEIFIHNGIELMCVEAQKENSCKGCWYKDDEKSPCKVDRNVAGSCINKYRSDCKDVIFMLVYPDPNNKPNTNYYLVEICSVTPNESYRVNKVVVSDKPLTRDEIIKEINLPSDYITKIEILEDTNGK